MEDKSYIKLFRKLLKSPIWENEKALKIWLWCLLKATHIEREQLVGQQIIKLEKGQFVFGREKASEELNMKESTVYKYIKLLEKLRMISIKSNNKFSIVSVEKWEDYQVEELNDNNKITTEEQQSNTNKNVKNILFILFNKYMSNFSFMQTAEEKQKLFKETCMQDEQFKELTKEQQTQLYTKLLSKM